MRDAKAEMDDTGKSNDFSDCVAIFMPRFRSAPFPAPVHGSGTHAVHERSLRIVYY